MLAEHIERQVGKLRNKTSPGSRLVGKVWLVDDNVNKASAVWQAPSVKMNGFDFKVILGVRNQVQESYRLVQKISHDSPEMSLPRHLAYRM